MVVMVVVVVLVVVVVEVVVGEKKFERGPARSLNSWI